MSEATHGAGSALDLATASRLFAEGQFAPLAAEADRWVDKAPSAETAPLIATLALACGLRGRRHVAEHLFRGLVAFEPANLQYRTNLGVLMLQSGRYGAARDLFQSCLREAPGDTDVQLNYALCDFALGNLAAAASLFEQVLQAQPDDDTARLYLARCLCELGRRHTAAELVRNGLPRTSSTRERYELAYLLAALDRPGEAEKIYRDILSDQPDEAEASMNLASLLERANRRDEARQLLDAMPAGLRESTLYWLLRARIDAPDDPQSALDFLLRAEKALPRDMEASARSRLLGDIAFERGRALDRLGRYADAHAAFTRGNEFARERYRRLVGALGEGASLPWLRDMPELDRAVNDARAEAADVESPVFVVGFPRSGTTLLDQMLDAHPQLQVMEEKPALEAVVQAVDRLPAGYPEALLTLDAAGRDRLRGVYWQAVGQHLERNPGRRLVDKYPLNLARLHLAMVLFPRAKWIFALRHPCDVVLSCFMQNFRFTNATHGFWSIPQTASLYAQIIGLWLKQRERLKPDCLQLRYEDLVADLEGAARQLLQFLGLPWDPAVLEYHRHARTRRINTPSYREVIKPIYASAVGRWKSYRPWFGDAEGALAPFVTQFGYAPLAEDR